MVRVFVGVITRARPRMLERLLNSFADLEMPPHAEVRFVIVENNGERTVEAVVDAFAQRVAPRGVHYDNEPVLGIPFARNRVLDIALNSGGDVLTFVDDDEVADRRWLVELVKAHRDRGLHLVGGPVRLSPVLATAAPLAKLLHRGLERRNERIEAKSARRVKAGQDGGIPTITSNWLVDLDYVRQTGLKFDESLGYSGGSDVVFYRAAKAKGAKTGWATEAIVYELMSEDRLTVDYQFRRTRDQGIASYHRRYPTFTLNAVMHSVGFVAAKLLSIVWLLAVAPFCRGATVTAAVRNAGYAWGRVLAIRGIRSRHYEKVQGF